MPDPAGHDQPGARRVIQPANDLAALIQARLEALGDSSGPLGMRAAARRSRDLVTATHIANLAKGTAQPTGISDRVAQGLALALDLPVSRIYEAARVPQPRARWVLPEELDRLPEPKRRVVEDVARALLDSYEQGARGAPWQ